MTYPVTLQSISINTQRIEVFVPDNQSIIEAYKNNKQQFISPYWAQVWPAAIGLCHFIEDHLFYIKNKKVLELAAGLGLPGIFCARFAKQVCISDIEPAAISFMQQSVLHNKLVNVDCQVIDWNDLQGVAIPEILLLSDINYEPVQFKKLLLVIRYFLSNHCTIILSTPQRLMAKDFINQLFIFCKEQSTEIVHWEGQEIPISIFVLNESKQVI